MSYGLRINGSYFHYSVLYLDLNFICDNKQPPSKKVALRKAQRALKSQTSADYFHEVSLVALGI